MKRKVKHPKVWIVWETRYDAGFAIEQMRAVCSRKWIADIDAQVLRESARNLGHRALVEVRPTLMNHLFGWTMLVRLREENLLNPKTGTYEDFERWAKSVQRR